MAATFHAEIITQGGVVFSGEVIRMRIPGREGYFGVLARHAPLIAEVAIGEIVIVSADGRERHFAVGGGVCEVDGNRVTILASSAEAATSIDAQRARAAQERARQRLAQAHDHPDIDVERAQLALMRATNRLHVATDRRQSR